MTWVNVVAITIGLAVMVRVSILLRSESLLPAPMHGILQVVGGFAIIVATLGIVVLTAP
jgi:hypothetical protein